MSRAIINRRPARRVRRARADPRPRARRRTPAGWRPDGARAWLRRPKRMLLAAGGVVIAVALAATASMLTTQAGETPPAESRARPVSAGGLILTSQPGWVRSGDTFAFPG